MTMFVMMIAFLVILNFANFFKSCLVFVVIVFSTFFFVPNLTLVIINHIINCGAFFLVMNITLIHVGQGVVLLTLVVVAGVADFLVLGVVGSVMLDVALLVVVNHALGVVVGLVNCVNDRLVVRMALVLF